MNLEEMEKEIAELKRNETHVADIMDIQLINDKQQAEAIAELKEELEHRAHMSDVNRTGVSNLFTNYGELKEQLDKGYGKRLFERLSNYEEVLREFLDLQYQ